MYVQYEVKALDFSLVQIMIKDLNHITLQALHGRKRELGGEETWLQNCSILAESMCKQVQCVIPGKGSRPRSHIPSLFPGLFAYSRDSQLIKNVKQFTTKT